MLDYLVLYESETGNTKKIATEIFASLPGMSKDLLNIHERNFDTLPEASTYFIGFCVHRGTCSMELGSFLSTLSGKNVALFGTCGAGNSEKYYKELENSAKVWLEDDNQYLGAFFCQGRMPQQVRQKYEALLHQETAENQEAIQMQIHNFDEAMIHPNKEDLQNTKAFAEKCLSELS